MRATVEDGRIDRQLDDKGEGPSGIYYLKDVARYLRATDLAARGYTLSLSPQQISGWGRRDFFDLHKNEFENNQSFVEFPHLITSRMIALLLSYGIKIRRIVGAHEYVRSETGIRFPFATKTFWTEDVDVPIHMYTKIDEILVAADEFGQMPFRGLLDTRIVNATGMGFDETRNAINWEPLDGVLIDPEIHSGAPCIKGTRIATAMIYGMHVAGETEEFLAEWYELTGPQVSSAIRWEQSLADTEPAIAA